MPLWLYMHWKLTGNWNTLAGQHLLGLIEAMDLVYEHDGSPLAQPQFVLRLLDHLSHVTGRRAGGRELHKAHRSLLLALAGYDVSESGLGKRERGEESKTRYELMIVRAAITSMTSLCVVQPHWWCSPSLTTERYTDTLMYTSCIGVYECIIRLRPSHCVTLISSQYV